MLEHHYPEGIPMEQQAALADSVLTREELEAASAARDACIAGIPGITWVEPFAWSDDGVNFTGGGYRVAPGVEEADVQPAADACYYRHVALVETAWLDQEHFGGWTEENLID